LYTPVSSFRQCEAWELQSSDLATHHCPEVRIGEIGLPAGYLFVDLEEKRDVIEYPIVDDIDLNGWDIRKALRLFSKSNPGFVEWIQSPLVYLEHGSRANRVVRKASSTTEAWRRPTIAVIQEQSRCR
jgi:predicted nucleotidyltransferase